MILAEVRENKMGTMPINKLLITTSVPMMISMMVQALYNVVDSLFVSRLGEDAFTALSVAFAMQNLMISVAVGTGVGVNALLSKSLGEKNQKLVDKTANNAITLALLTTIFFVILGFFIPRPYYISQLKSSTGADMSAIVNYGVEYLSIIMIFSVGIFLQVTMERLLVSTGRTVYSMITQMFGAIINIVLDPILIFGYAGAPAMGVKGAAVATVIGQCSAAALGIFFNKKLNPDITLRFKDLALDKKVVGRIYEVGVPSIVMGSIGSVMNFAMNRILVKFSTTAVAVFGAYFKLQSFIFMPVFGLNNGMVPIVAYNYGARRKSRIKKTVRLSMCYAAIIMVIGTILFETIPGTLLRIFDASPTMVEIGVPAMRIIAVHFVIAAFSIVIMSVFQALGNAVYSLICSVSRQLVVLIPAAYLLSLTGKLDLVWLAFPMAEVVSVTMGLLFLRRTYRKKLNFPDTPEAESK